MASSQYNMYYYTGLRLSTKVNGLQKASSVEELRGRLKSKEISLITAKPMYKVNGSLKTDVLIRFAGQMHSMIKNGISSVEALRMTAEYAEEDFRYILLDVLNHLNNGSKLADSFRRNGFFTELFCETVAMGEESGNLAESFKNIRGFYMSEKDIRRKVKSMMSYPCIVLVILLIVTIVMSTFVLPQFGDVYEGMGAELPAITNLYIRFGQYIIGGWWMILGAVFAVTTGFKKYKKNLLHRKNLDRFVLDIPLIGGIQNKILVARFSNVLALYLKSGVQMQDSMLSSARILQNMSVYDEFLRGIKLILKGHSFFEIVEDISIFPPFFKQVVYTGERSGDLANSLVRLAETMDEDARETLDTASKNVNQFIVIGLFVLLAPTIIAILLPVVNLTQVASQAGGL